MRLISGYARGTRLALLSAVLLAVVACADSPAETAVPQTPESPTSFYIEAQVSVDVDDTASPFPPEAPIISTLKWWFKSPDRFRSEIDTVQPARHVGSSLVVTESNSWISYDANLNRYESSPQPAFPEGILPAPITSVPLGPIRGGTIENWIRLNRQTAPRFDAELLRVEKFLGRETGVYEFSDVGALLSEEGTIASGSTGRLWLDTSTGLVLRFEGADNTGITAEVTLLDINPVLDDEIFVFRAPVGAVQSFRSASSLSVRGGISVGEGSNPPEGLLEIRRLPQAFQSAVMESSSTSNSMGIAAGAENMWALGDGSAIRISQKVRKTGLPDGFVTGEMIVSSATQTDGYHITRSEDESWIRLAWQDGDVTVVVEGVGVPLQELLRTADLILHPGIVVIPEG